MSRTPVFCLCRSSWSWLKRSPTSSFWLISSIVVTRWPYCESEQCTAAQEFIYINTIQLIIHDINFVYVNIFKLLINIFLFLIFIKYFIDESKVKIKSLGQKYFVKKIIKLLQLCNSYCIKALFLNVLNQCSIKIEY
jgi:hypothetical protein